MFPRNFICLSYVCRGLEVKTKSLSLGFPLLCTSWTDATRVPKGRDRRRGLVKGPILLKERRKYRYIRSFRFCLKTTGSVSKVRKKIELTYKMYIQYRRLLQIICNSLKEDILKHSKYFK